MSFEKVRDRNNKPCRGWCSADRRPEQLFLCFWICLSCSHQLPFHIFPVSPFFSPLPHFFSGLSFGNFSSYPFLEYETILEKIKWNQILFLIQNAFQTPRFFCSCWAASANWPELLSWQGGALYRPVCSLPSHKTFTKTWNNLFHKTIFFLLRLNLPCHLFIFSNIEYLLFWIMSQIVKPQVLQCFVSFWANFMYGWRAQRFALVCLGKN